MPRCSKIPAGADVAIHLPFSVSMSDNTTSPAPDTGDDSTGSLDDLLGLRIASVFIILVGSMFGALFPVLAKRTRWLAPRIPKGVFDFAKYFGSGVIVSPLY